MKYPVMFIVFISILVAVLATSNTSAAASSWETSGFRTLNGSLVRVGMSKADVRREAGEPLGQKKPGQDKATKIRSSGSKKKTAGKKKSGEVWTYRGTDGYYAVRFSGGTVSGIDVTPDRF